MMVLTDMAAAVLMFILVTVFRRVSMTVVHTPARNQLEKFVPIKKSIAVLLCIVLLILAAFNLAQWLEGVAGFTELLAGQGKDLDFFFFPAFFEFMIFTDVFLLIVSIPFFERYEYVIRNAGFVISTVLLRFSLSTPQPYDLAISVTAMFYGVCILDVFSYFTQVETAQLEDE